MKKKKLIQQITRFLAGGAVGGTLNYIIFFWLDALGIWYQAANFVGFIVGTGVNFFIQKHWAFKNKEKEYGKQISFFVIAKIIILLTYSYSLYFWIEIIQTNKILAQIWSTLLITVISFLLTKKIFKQKDSN